MTTLIIVGLTLAFIIIDIVTGLVKAFKNKEYKSSKMREGLFHKASFVFIIGIAFLIEFAQGFVDLGVTIPLATPACVYVIITELGSIIENLCAINPALIPETLRALFGNISTEKKSDAEDIDPKDDNDA